MYPLSTGLQKTKRLIVPHLIVVANDDSLIVVATAAIV
jgi:hypothetical protein